MHGSIHTYPPSIQHLDISFKTLKTSDFGNFVYRTPVATNWKKIVLKISCIYLYSSDGTFRLSPLTQNAAMLLIRLSLSLRGKGHRALSPPVRTLWVSDSWTVWTRALWTELKAASHGCAAMKQPGMGEIWRARDPKGTDTFYSLAILPAV